MNIHCTFQTQIIFKIYQPTPKITSHIIQQTSNHTQRGKTIIQWESDAFTHYPRFRYTIIEKLLVDEDGPTARRANTPRFRPAGPGGWQSGWFLWASTDGWVVSWRMVQWNTFAQWTTGGSKMERVSGWMGVDGNRPLSIYKLHHFRSAVRERTFSQRASFLSDDRSHARLSWKRC